VRAYRNAARAVRDHPTSAAELDRKALQEILGVGADLAEKITTLIATGDFPLNRELVTQVPPSLLQLLTLPGFGPKRVKLLADRLGVHDRASLRHANAFLLPLKGGPTMTGDRMLCPREGRL
jgi:DNA polymerase (family 10)